MRKEKDNMEILKNKAKRKWVVRSSIAVTAATAVGLAIALPWKQTKSPDAMLVVDQGNIYDKSFNEGTLNGLNNAQNALNKKFSVGAVKAESSNEAGLGRTYNSLHTLGSKLLALPGFKHTNALAEYHSNGTARSHANNSMIHLDDGNAQFISEKLIDNFPMTENAARYAGYSMADKGSYKDNPMYKEKNVWPIKYKMETASFPMALLMGMDIMNKGFAGDNNFYNPTNQTFGSKANVITWGGNPFGTVYDFMSGLLDGLAFFSMSFANDQTSNTTITTLLNGFSSSNNNLRNFKVPETWKQITQNKMIGIMSPRDLEPISKGDYSKDRFFTFTFSPSAEVVSSTVAHSLTPKDGNIAHYFMPVAGPQTNNILQAIAANPSLHGQKRVIGVDSDATQSFSNYKNYVFGSVKKELTPIVEIISKEFFQIELKDGVKKANEWFKDESRNRNHYDQNGQLVNDLNSRKNRTVPNKPNVLVDNQLKEGTNEPTQKSHPHNVFGFIPNKEARLSGFKNLRGANAIGVPGDAQRSAQAIYSKFKENINDVSKGHTKYLPAWTSLTTANSTFEDFAVEATERFASLMNREISGAHPAFIDKFDGGVIGFDYKPFNPESPIQP